MSERLVVLGRQVDGVVPFRTRRKPVPVGARLRANGFRYSRTPDILAIARKRPPTVIIPEPSPASGLLQ